MKCKGESHSGGHLLLFALRKGRDLARETDLVISLGVQETSLRTIDS